MSRAAEPPRGGSPRFLSSLPRSLRPCVMLLAALATRPGSPAAAQAPAPAAPEVLMVGSSSVRGPLGNTIRRALEGWGVGLARRSRGASGFARPDFYDWQAQLPGLTGLDRYAGVLLLTGGNDAQSLRADDGGWVRWHEEDAWTAVYTERVRRFVQGLCANGARRVVVLLPGNGGRPLWAERIGRVRAGLAAGTASTSCGVAVDGGDDLLPSHDGVHLSRRGSERMWARVAPRVRRLLGLPPSEELAEADAAAR